LPTNLLERGYQTPVEVFNAGVPGYTSYQGLLYLQHELLAHRPDLVAIQFGWNDHWQGPTGVADKDIRLPSPAVFRLQQGLAHSRLYRLLRTAMLPKPPANASPRVPLEDYRRNLREMVQLVQRQGGRVMLLTAPYLDNNEYWRDTHLAYIEATRQLAAETGATLVDLTPEFLHRPDLFLWPDSDKCHFGAAGAVIAAGMAAQAIIKHELLP
jgi:lysophospholipase L1-like esterase